jgi:PAS domain-containing protein
LAVPTLEDVRTLQRPAWLWDSRRGRIAWANDSGVAFFGGETVFDVIDRLFDQAEPGIETIAAIGRTLRRGETVEALLLFPSAGKSKPTACTCYIHALPDGRHGVLVVADENEIAKGISEEELAAALELLPAATILTSREGEIRFANQAAKELLNEDNRSGLESELRVLVSRLDKVGTVSLIRRIETVIGERDLRITARRLKGESDNACYAVVTLEDITDRRELERQLTSKLQNRPPGKPEPVRARLTDNEVAAFDALGAVLKQAAHPPAISQRKEAETAPVPPPVLETPPLPAAADEAANESQAEPARPSPRSPVSSVERPVEPVIPLFIRKTLDSFPGANLFVRSGKIVYANPSAIELLKHPGLVTLLGSGPLAEAAANSNNEAVELPCADGTRLRVTMKSTQVPWINGPADRLNITLAPLEPKPAIEASPAPEEPEAATPAEEPASLTGEVETVSSIAEEKEEISLAAEEAAGSVTKEEEEVNVEAEETLGFAGDEAAALAPEDVANLASDEGEAPAPESPVVEMAESVSQLEEPKETGPPGQIAEAETANDHPPPPVPHGFFRQTALPPPPSFDSIIIPEIDGPAAPNAEESAPSLAESFLEPPILDGSVSPSKAREPAGRPSEYIGAYSGDDELRAILDTAADGIITLDGNGAIRTLSAGAEAIFGYRAAEVEGKPSRPRQPQSATRLSRRPARAGPCLGFQRRPRGHRRGQAGRRNSAVSECQQNAFDPPWCCRFWRRCAGYHAMEKNRGRAARCARPRRAGEPPEIGISRQYQP